MNNEIVIEYLSNELESLFETSFLYVPSIGRKIWIDEKPFEVTEIEPFFYKETCKQNKIRIYLDPLKEE